MTAAALTAAVVPAPRPKGDVPVPMPVHKLGPIDRRHMPAHKTGRVGVIDIGSNSIRLVIYDKLSRSPIPVFNEKVLCGLGRDLAQSKRLYPPGVTLALDNLKRFCRLLQGMGVGNVDVLATAAVREAEDGDAFAARVNRDCGLTLQVISGEEEARLSAMGVLCGIPAAEGVMGDLGGGSLELVGLDGGQMGSHVTLPLGPFRLMGRIEPREAEARQHVDTVLGRLGWLSDFAGRTLYPVGGSWRAIAKIAMARAKPPIHVIHQYTIGGGDLQELCGLIARQQKTSLERMAGVSRRRIETLPYAALVMERLLARLRPERVVFSAFGLREGHLFDLLEPEERARDPLLVTAREVAADHARYGFGSAGQFEPWIAPIFVGEDAGEPGWDDRLRSAACLLSDIGWAEHPDYRREHAYLRVLRLQVPGVDHTERAYLACALYVRYGGSLDDALVAPAAGLLSGPRRHRALLLGQALRLAHTLTGGATGMLEGVRLVRTERRVELVLPPESAHLPGDVVQRRLDALTKTLKLPEAGGFVFPEPVSG